MKTTEDYKKLIEGYSFSLSILKNIKPKFYHKIMRTKKIFEKRGENYHDFIRNLRVDYINEYDEKDSGIPLISIFDFGVFKESVSLNYMPNEGYSLGMMFEKESILGQTKMFCEIFPTTLNDVKENKVVHILRISTLKKTEKESFEAKKVVNYIAGIAEGSLLILVQDIDRPKAIKAGLEIPLEELNVAIEDLSNMF